MATETPTAPPPAAPPEDDSRETSSGIQIPKFYRPDDTAGTSYGRPEGFLVRG